MQPKTTISPENVENLYWKEGLSIKTISNIMNTYPAKIHRLMKTYKINRRSYSDSLRFSIKIPSKEVLSYLAGVLYGDGSINNNGTFELQAIDKDFVMNTFQKMNTIAPSKFKILNRKTTGQNTVYSSRINRKNLNTILISTTFDKANKIPFINGFIDSEGNVNTHNRTINIYSDNKQLLQAIQKFMKTNNIRTSLYTRNTHYTITLKDKKSILEFHKRFMFSIKRKQDNLERIIKSYRSDAM